MLKLSWTPPFQLSVATESRRILICSFSTMGRRSARRVATPYVLSGLHKLFGLELTHVPVPPSIVCCVQ
jgi:hypothetical protein